MIKISDIYSIITTIVFIHLVIGFCFLSVGFRIFYFWVYENILKKGAKSKRFRISLYLLLSGIFIGGTIGMIYLSLVILNAIFQESVVLGFFFAIIFIPIVIALTFAFIVFYIKGMFRMRREFKEAVRRHELATGKRGRKTVYDPRGQSEDKKEKEIGTIQCPLCGELISTGTKYCTNCGSSVN